MTTTYLLDANAFIAVAVAEHEHHHRATHWIGTTTSFAVCPIVEGALVRFVLRMGERPGTAAALIERFRAHERCRFWPDGLSYGDIDISDLRGHRQVTDAYLAALAQHHSARLATFDTALVSLRPEATYLIPELGP